jgi:type III secretory pathway component EscR|tara:strand:+ start:447 stop:707 length:261 start_codon:yes stop_codon:yes gene_type:complete
MGNSPVDRDINYMREMWGTTKLATDYINYYENEEMNPQNDFLDNLANQQHQKMLREISNDDITPKKRDTINQEDLYEKTDDNTELF